MHRLRSSLTSFRRIHLAALIADWRRTLLSVIGVALGVTVVLGVLVLKSELSRPFDSFGPSLTHAADIGVVEVSPNVSGRLPIETVDRLQSEVAGARGGHPDRRRLDARGRRGRKSRVLLARRVVSDRASRRAFRLRAARPRRQARRRSRRATRDARGHRRAARRSARRRIADPRSATRFGAPGLDVPGVRSRRGRSTTATCCIAPSADVAATLLSTPGYVTAAFILPEARGPTSPPTSIASSQASQRSARHGRTCLPCSRTATQSLQPHRAGRHHRRHPHRGEHRPAGRRGPASGDGHHRRDRCQTGRVVRRDAR